MSMGHVADRPTNKYYYYNKIAGKRQNTAEICKKWLHKRVVKSAIHYQ